MWVAFVYWALPITVSLIVAIDAAVGLSSRIAVSISRPAQADFIILTIALILTFGGLYWFHNHSFIRTNIFADYATIQESIAAPEKARRVKALISIGHYIIAFFLVVSVLTAIVLAYNRKRRLLIWIPLAILGSFGSVIWLSLHSHAPRRGKSG
jgi:hypothetical protein